MPRGREREPGIRDLPGVVNRGHEVYPNHYDNVTARGEFCGVPREPVYRTMDFGGEPTGRGSLGAKASASYTQGTPSWTQSVRDQRVLPESQLDGSLNVQAGLGTPKMTQQKVSPRAGIEKTGG